MLQLIYGPPGSGKTETLLKRLAGDLSAGLSCVILVPEQQVVLTERKVASLLRGEESLRVEVLSFRRLCNRVFREYGGLCYHYLDEGGQALVLWQVLSALSPRLEEYGGTTLHDKAVIELLLAELRTLKRAAITPAQLEKAASGEALRDEAHTGLRKKLQDLALLYSGYEQAIADGFDDPEEDLPRLCAVLDGAGKDFFAGKTVYLDGFSDLTGQEYAVVDRLLRRAQKVTVTVNKRPEDSRELLWKVSDFARALQHLAAEAKVSVDSVTLEEPDDRPKSLRYLERSFFGEDTEDPAPAADGAVSVVACETPYEEVTLLAEAILRDVQQGGHFRDHAVAVRDTGSYAGIVESVFAACGIPVFLSRRGQLIWHAAVRAIFHAVEIVRGGWQTEEVLRYLKTGFAGGLSEEDCFLFEQYVRCWNMKGSRFYDDYGFTMHPAGYREEFTEADVVLLQRLNGIRRDLTAPLVKLQEAFVGGSDKHTAADLTEALYTFLCEIGMKDRLSADAAEARRAGRPEDAERLAQLWNLICDVLDTVHEAAGQLPCGAALFSELLQTVFAARDVGSIPTSLDQVVFSDALLLRGDGIRTLHILGANEGVFPATPGNGSVFSDPDLELLRTLDPPIELKTDSLRMAEEELHTFYSCISMPREQLRISYSRTDLRGSEKQPADAVGQILSLLEIEEAIADSLPLSGRLYSRRSVWEAALQPDESEEDALTKAAVRRLLADALPTGELAAAEEQIGAENAAKRFSEAVNLSPSGLETYVNCPFSYHMKYTLGLEEEKQAEQNSNTRGTIVHLVLERFLRKMKDENRFAPDSEPITDGEIESLSEAILGEYLETVCGGSEPVPKMERQLRQIRNFAALLLKDLRDEFTVSAFRPAFFELPIGLSSHNSKESDGLRLEPMELPLSDGGKVRVRGSVDRVDAFVDGENCYLRVVDYKTYQKSLSVNDPAKGKNLQMLIYLMALCREGQKPLLEKLSLDESAKLIPAGTLYYVAAQGTVERRPGENAAETVGKAKNALKRSGIYLGDDAVKTAMDSTGSKRLVPKSGMLGEEEFRALLLTTAENLCRVAEDIRSGKADAAPVKEGNDDGCKYCKMNPICRRQYQVGDRNDEQTETDGDADGMAD